jgi:nitroreductase
MQLAAWELGVGSCLATIYEYEPARQLLGYPSEMHLHIAISFGYPVDHAYLTTHPQKGGRRSMEDIVHWDRW